MKIPRQILIKSGLGWEEAARLLLVCKAHKTSETVYHFFVMNNMSTSKDLWSLNAQVIGVSSFSDTELVIE
jgi:hypothetical protein